MQYIEYWVHQIYKLLWSYQGDKPVLLWQEKIKDGHHDSDILLNLSEKIRSLEIITTCTILNIVYIG